MFITKYGSPWLKNTPDNPISKEIAKRLTELGIRRPGVNFYALRHTFETIGSESRDQVAVDSIMGHAPDTDDMASVYRERISDERFRAVTEYVRGWLFAKSNDPSRSALGERIAIPATILARAPVHPRRPDALQHCGRAS